LEIIKRALNVEKQKMDKNKPAYQLTVTKELRGKENLSELNDIMAYILQQAVG